MELFPKIVNAKCFILDVWQGSECASAWICYISKCSFTATSRKTKNFSESCRENNSFFQLYPRIKFWLFLTYLCSFDSKINFILSKEQLMKQNTFQVLPDNWFWIKPLFISVTAKILPRKKQNRIFINKLRNFKGFYH